PDTLERATAAIAVQPGLGVVGVPVRPHAAHPLERLHWRLADWLRARELDCGTASIVTAPCYFARRELLANLPPDTVADDVHVACRAMRDGWRVGLVGARATEMRAPRTLGALFRHKFRKADAYLREIFRFLPDVGQMRPPMRSVFLWRAFLLTVFPPLAVLAAGQALWLLVALLAGDVGTVALTAGVAPILSIPLLFGRSREVALLVALGCVLVMVSALALLFYPISTQTASLAKILQPPDCRFSEGLE
ncbi:MAG: glycosyltransferase family 2 protein, partial [Acidobacteria bacterium]